MPPRISQSVEDFPHSQLRLWQKLLRMDWGFLALGLLLCCLSVIFVYSATFASDLDEYRYAYRSQIIWIGLGMIGYFILALTDYRIWMRFSIAFLLICMVLLLYVWLHGHTSLGAKRWIRIGPISLQPPELTKLAFILFMGWVLTTFRDRGWKMFFGVFTLLSIPVFLIMKQPDLGSALVFVPVTYMMLFAAGVKKRYLIAPILLGVAVLVFLYVRLHPSDPNVEPTIPGLAEYQQNRIKTFLDSTRDPRGAAWTINQSMIAIGSGGLTGKGYLQGATSALGFLPRNIAHTDFIYPVICEQFGFVGGTTLICLLALLLLWILKIAITTTDTLGVLLCVGIFCMFFTHIFVNIGMTLKLLPVVGIPLPFTSYGGTFLVMCLAATGLVQSIWIHRKN